MITYLHLGQDVTVSLKDVIGIFDIEKTTVNKITREFLKNGEKSGSVINVSYELPKSFVVTQENDHTSSPGKDADIVLLDDDCSVIKTIVRGVCKFER